MIKNDCAARVLMINSRANASCYTFIFNCNFFLATTLSLTVNSNTHTYIYYSKQLKLVI
jgi:hypothetical protein